MTQEKGVEALVAVIPDCAKDLRINLPNVLRVDEASGLDHRQLAGIALASAYAAGERRVISGFLEQAEGILGPEELAAAKSAAAIMAMNNVYYRFVHLSNDPEYGRMPAGLRMSVIGNPGIPKHTFELYALAVSAVNGCGMCMESHARLIVQAGLPRAAVQHAVRVAAVVAGVAQAVAIA